MNKTLILLCVLEHQENSESVLRKIDVPIVPRKVCQDILRSTRLGKYFILHQSFICAGGQTGKDTCKVRFLIK